LPDGKLGMVPSAPRDSAVRCARPPGPDYLPVYVTRQTTSATSSAINRAPSLATARPAGRPQTLAGSPGLPIPFQKPVTKFS